MVARFVMKSNKKQIISILAILTMAILLSCAFVACDKVDTDKTGTDIVADYKVTIHPNNGQSDIVWDITKEIPTITKDGFHIAGYFLDAQLTISTTLESLKATGITKNIDVYVKWEEDVCEHVEVTDVAVAPTCTEKGLTEGKHCSKCGKILKAQTEIDALGHDLETHNGQEATCTEKGWKEHVTCKREGCGYTTYQEIPALGHTGGTATCTEQATCERCNEKYGNALGHKYGTLIPQTNATCSATGIRSHYKCSSCNKLFANDEHKTEITETDLIIPIDENAHDFGKWTRNDGAETHTRVCSFNSEHTETENCLGGTATCTEQAVCEKCNEKYGELAKHDYKNGVCTRCGTERASEGLEYSLNSDETGYTVTGIGSCTDTEIVIPSKHNSKPVTNIGSYAFRNRTGLTSVTIPDSVTSIGEHAFFGCTRLTSVTIPDSVTSIGGFAFRNCTGLTSVTIPDSVTIICAGAFYNCTGLTSVTIGNSVMSIGGFAFFDCTGLTNITIPNSVTYIGAGAFSGCTGLTSITIPDSVTYIGYEAFSGCTELTSITIPNSVTSIGSNAFYNTAWYNNQPDGLVYAGKVAYKYKGEMPSNTSIVLKEGTLSIGYSTFSGCTGLTSITIPDSVTNIGEDAFYNTAWYNNQSNGLVYAGKVAYKYKGEMPNNTSIVLKEGTLGIGDSAFFGCKGLTSITIPDSVTSIGENAFGYCTNLADVIIPNNVASIGSNAFQYCIGLTSVTIGNGVTCIGEDAFFSCNRLIEVYNKSSLKIIAGDSSFGYVANFAKNVYTEEGGSKLSKDENGYVIYTDGDERILVAYLGTETKLTLPTDITQINQHAFSFYSWISRITIPNSVTSIGEYAFYECTGLTSATIGNSVTSIGRLAFQGCTGLTSITIPDSVTSIGGSAFSRCTGLTSITIPNSVTSIGDEAFSGCSGLTSVTIGNSVTSIGSYAFYECYRLVEVYNKSALSITAGSSSNGGVAYYAKNVYTNEGGSKLTTDENGYVIYTDGDEKILVAYTGTNTELVLPSYITKINQYAFYNCSGLTSVTIPDSVTSIGGGAFYNCYRLVEVYNKSTLSITAGSSSNGYVAYYAKNVYTNEGGSKLTEDENGYVIYTDEDEKILIAYTGTETELTLPSDITQINQYAFYNCSALTSITIPDSVTSIGYDAFYNCTSLTSITFNGTIAQWNAIEKGSNWKYNVPNACNVVCTDGTISIY